MEDGRQSSDRLVLPAGMSREGVILIDDAGSVVEWSPALEKITGILRSDVLGKKLWDIYFSLLPPDKNTSLRPEYFKDLVLTTLDEGTSGELVRSFEHEIRHPDTGIRIVESIMFTIPEGDRITAGSIIRDITERKKAEESLHETNRRLSIISSTARHDINNQLTVFNGYLSLMECGGLDMESGDLVRILQGATDKIVRILRFTGEYQDIGMKPPAWQDLCEAIQLAKATIEVSAVRFSPAVTCNKVEILADPQLVRAFYNLIDNSLRHGEIVSEIQIHCTVKDNQLLIVYEDDGVGITDRNRPVLFERGKGKNSGYGTFLVREILAVTGISISEKGTAGKGACFEMIVPAGSFRMINRT